MVVEALDPGQGWPIPLPQEHDALLDRVLEAHDLDGRFRARWRYGGSQMSCGWLCVEGVEPGPNVPTVGVQGTGFYDLFEEIVAGCIKHGWTLWSMPPVAKD